MNGRDLTLGLVAGLAVAGAVRRRGSRSTADTVWFHGRTARSDRFDLERVGDRYATNQQGPGFYFTTDRTEARSYAHPSGIVLQAKLRVPRWVSTKAPPDRAEVERLMRASPVYEDALTDWDESPQRAHQKALRGILTAENQHEAFLNVWGEFYRRADENAAYLRALVKLGYGGVYIPNPHGAPHAVVFSPDFLEEVTVVDDLGTGPVGSSARRGSRAALWPDADTLADDFTHTMHSASPAQMKRWAKARGLVYLGSGMSRAVFARPRGDTVLKLVFSSYGREANLDESRAWREAAPRIQTHLVPVLDVDPLGRWLVMERVKTRNEADEVPAQVFSTLARCGFLDIRAQNVAADGRLLDYGLHLWDLWGGACRS